MNIKHSFVKPEIECTLAAGCSVTGEPFAIELAHVKGRLTMVSGKPVKAGGRQRRRPEARPDQPRP